MRQHSFGAILGFAQLAFGAAVYDWPNPQLETLDNQLYRPGFSLASFFALGCNERDNTTVAAQWLRLAYHDMATHNKNDGTGGLDASIAYELDRAQNVGPGMRATLSDFSADPNEYVSMADIIALGAINSVISCGDGPVIPFRGGRIDATQAGPETVPEPQQDFASHLASFDAQGFNQSEMIALVACGHALGGVRKVDFPLIVTDDVELGVQSFTPVQVEANNTGKLDFTGFDNTVVQQYLNGTTDNVLVVGTNVSTRSDLRIFSSDNNATMQRLASSTDTFNEVCGDLIGRMVNTVPSGVELTDVIEPFDYKAENTMLFPQGGSLAFLATLRIIHFASVNQTVTLYWKERTGTFCPEKGCSIGAFLINNTPVSHYASLKGLPSFDFHSFNASIDLATSISHFWFEVNHNNGSAPCIVDNHGKNYTIDQDTLLFDPRRSGFGADGFKIVAGVKEATSGSANVTALATVGGTNESPVMTRQTLQFAVDAAFPPTDGYTFYSASHIPDSVLSYTLRTALNGTDFSSFVLFLNAPGVD